MYRITERICDAFLSGMSLKIDNTLTKNAEIWLHGSKIAFWSTDEVLQISLRGWNTVTTRERLNGLLTMLGSNWRIVQRKHRPYAINLDLEFHVDNETNCWIPLIDIDWYNLPNMAKGNHEWFSRGYPVGRCSRPTCTDFMDFRRG